MALIELPIPPEHHGQRLDRFLALVLAGQSRSQIQRLIAEGRVVVRSDPPESPATPREPAASPHASTDHSVSPHLPGRPPAVKASHLVHAGDTVALDIPPPPPSGVAREALPLDVLYEDPDVIVINKPAGMVVHPSAGHASGTLVNALLHHVEDLSGVGGELRPGIVHRLDRGTSGVMIVAKNDEAHRELARQFEDREVEKEYIALVWGVVNAGRRIDAPIGRDPAHRQKMSSRARRARHAVTRITRVRHLPGLTLCQVSIHTGRTHQIRVHLSAIGHPVVGDALYGGVHRHVPGDIRAVQRLERPFLHAARLGFTHPRDGSRLAFTAPLPEDLLHVLEDLPGWKEEQ